MVKKFTMQFNFYVYGKRRPLDTLFPALVLTQSRHTWPTNTKIWLILSHKKRSIANPGSNHDPVNLPAIWSIAPALYMLLDVYLIRQRLGRIKRHCFSLTRYSWVRMGDKSLRKRQSEEKDSGKE